MSYDNPPPAAPEPPAGPQVPGAVPEVSQWGYSSAPPPESGHQPVWQFLLLSICSFGIYEVVWFYRNWCVLRDHRNLNITALARAIFSPFFLISFHREVGALAVSAGGKIRHSPVLLGIAYWMAMFASRSMDRIAVQVESAVGVTLLANAFFVVGLLTLVPAVQNLNTYWRHAVPDHEERRGLSPGAWAVTILGSLWWLVVIAGQFLPE